jgi:hypothetical protein
MTENPTIEFVRQQLMLFSESVACRAYLIHDNALMFDIDYLPLQSRIRQNRSGSAEPEQHYGAVFQDSKKRGAAQFSADREESGSEDSG